MTTVFLKKEPIMPDGTFMETYVGKTTTGMEVMFIYNNSVLKSTVPVVKM